MRASRNHVRPDLGLDQQAHLRRTCVQKPPYRTRRIPGLPELHIAGLQQGRAGCASGRCAVGQDDAYTGNGFAQCGQQQARSPGFAQRDRVDPDAGTGPLAQGLQDLGRVIAKAFIHPLPVHGLSAGTATQAPAQHRNQGPAQEAVHPQSQTRGQTASRCHTAFSGRAAHADSQACSTVGTSGVNVPPTAI